MIETECQKLVIDAVQEVDGRGLKFNNRFLIGVCDLFLKMPGHEPMLLEAKLANLSEKTLEKGHVWDVGATKKQQDFLRDWHDAGMLTGVVSFIQVPGKGVASLRMAVYSYQYMVGGGNGEQWAAASRDHVPLGGKSERLFTIRTALIRFAQGEN